MGLSVLACTACKDTSFKRGEEIEVHPTVTERYENQKDIEGQWGSNPWTGGNDYGIGDPFVMRYNGKYYMYPSTNDAYSGVKVFVSDDAVNWTYCGLALSDGEETSHGAYAPEVVYYNGYFYMCQSRGGKGHYIYRSESPTEGFTLVSKTDNLSEDDIDYGNLYMGIDGAFYVSDDGKLYLLHTSTPAGLKYNEIENVDDIRSETIGPTRVLGDANLNHWIEGPGIFRRGDYSYLTYTGNHVISKGYRVAYSYAENLEALSSFTQPTDNVTIIDTSAEHYGLGHSSNFNGPDLDSVYTAYHSYVSGGPCRRYNVDRYFASGSLLTANGVNIRAVATPSKPTASVTDGSGLKQTDGIYSLGRTDKYFTVEYNVIPSDGQALYFGNGYAVRFTDNGIALNKNGALVAEKQSVYAKDRLNTLRVENGDGVGYVYLNGMRLISYEAEGAAGAVGYAKTEGVQYTAFTNDVFGTSDFEAVKNFSTRFPAITYLKGENRGFSIAKAKVERGGVRVGEKQSVVKTENDEYAVQLGQGDWVKYAVDVPSSETYSVSARVASCTNATLRITVGEREHTVSLSESGNANVSLGTMLCDAGVTTMKVEVLSGEADLIWLDVQGAAAPSVTAEAESFERLNGTVTAENGELIVTGTTKLGDDGVAVWGGRGMSDYEAELTFSAESEDTDFGFMIRSNDYSYHSAQPTQSWRGYYLQVTPQLVSMSRYDYSEEVLGAKRASGLLDGEEHTLKVRAQGNRIQVWIDGELMLDVTDGYAFPYGKFGVFVGAGSVTVKNYRFGLL